MDLQWLIPAAAGLLAFAIGAFAGLRAWSGWLDLKRQELARPGGGCGTEPSSPAGARIELADLRERVRKLEAIAVGVDL